MRRAVRFRAVSYTHLLTDSLMEGQRGTIFVEKTPFYATMGGQQGDTGVITTADGVFRVEEAIHLRGGKIGHVGVMAVSYTHLSPSGDGADGQFRNGSGDERCPGSQRIYGKK